VPVDPRLSALGLRSPRFVEVRAANGDTLHGALLPPCTMEPGKRYPVVVMVYGGPAAQTVANRWRSDLLWNHLADRNIIVFQLDNRGSAGRGPAFQAQHSHGEDDRCVYRREQAVRPCGVPRRAARLREPCGEPVCHAADRGPPGRKPLIQRKATHHLAVGSPHAFRCGPNFERCLRTMQKRWPVGASMTHQRSRTQATRLAPSASRRFASAS
jgi:hypothetical protein